MVAWYVATTAISLAYLLGIVYGRRQREQELYTAFKPKIKAILTILSSRRKK